ncbi:response regulator transcription factor [Naasia sp. SYSU D00948]|uniref:response regulator transcription factor n=1 Tax=Naasia sp. SYSU D00948 TaxID=2817379 RepID=UPI001B305F1B|nr:response regulator transcription factor [Naasia sp. SYSU D00948]
MAALSKPICVALVNDYDVVLIGLAHMFDKYKDRIVVAEIDANHAVNDEVDVVLYDSFAQPESGAEAIEAIVRNARGRKVAIYTWNFAPELIENARKQGVDGYLSKTMPARELVAAIERIAAGEQVFQEPPPRAGTAMGLDWPGRREGITDRESEILALITQGKSNAEVARITYLSPNTVKSYIRSIYRKIGVESRTQAVLWGVDHGFAPDYHRIDHWQGGP